jgi:hypothetical protein
MWSLNFFNLPNPSSRTMAPGFTQPLTEMDTRRSLWGMRPAHNTGGSGVNSVMLIVLILGVCTPHPDGGSNGSSGSGGGSTGSCVHDVRRESLTSFKVRILSGNYERSTPPTAHFIKMHLVGQPSLLPKGNEIPPIVM